MTHFSPTLMLKPTLLQKTQPLTALTTRFLSSGTPTAKGVSYSSTVCVSKQRHQHG
jgi:hypothetical protein